MEEMAAAVAMAQPQMVMVESLVLMAAVAAVAATELFGQTARWFQVMGR